MVDHVCMFYIYVSAVHSVECMYILCCVHAVSYICAYVCVTGIVTGMCIV